LVTAEAEDVAGGRRCLYLQQAHEKLTDEFDLVLAAPSAVPDTDGDQAPNPLWCLAKAAMRAMSAFIAGPRSSEDLMLNRFQGHACTAPSRLGTSL
jgi:hypothetical protein